MFSSSFLVFVLLFLTQLLTETRAKEECLDNMNRRELRDYVREQESITHIPKGRIILQLMEKYRVEKNLVAKATLSENLERAIRSYRILMKKQLKHFLWSETTQIATDQLTRFAFFLMEKDCHNPPKLKAQLRTYFSEYWRNQNWTERAIILKKIKENVITCSTAK